MLRLQHSLLVHHHTALKEYPSMMSDPEKSFQKTLNASLIEGVLLLPLVCHHAASKYSSVPGISFQKTLLASHIEGILLLSNLLLVLGRVCCWHLAALKYHSRQTQGCNAITGQLQAGAITARGQWYGKASRPKQSLINRKTRHQQDYMGNLTCVFAFSFSGK